MVTKLDELKKIKSRSDKERWFLKNLLIFKDMKIRKTRAGYTVYNNYSKFLVEFSDETDTAYLADNKEICYSRFLFIYKEKFGLCWKEIVLSDVIENMINNDRILKG